MTEEERKEIDDIRSKIGLAFANVSLAGRKNIIATRSILLAVLHILSEENDAAFEEARKAGAYLGEATAHIEDAEPFFKDVGKWS